MRFLSMVLTLMLFLSVARAEMVRNDTIGNDPEKQKLCESRAKEKVVPFEIDSNYVERVRRFHPDTTFVAIDGISPQLIECRLRSGTGRYEPDTFNGESDLWHLIRPKQFEPGINTFEGKEIASKKCRSVALEKINQPNLDHSVDSSVIEINNGGGHYHHNTKIAGMKAERYDIAVEGTAFYKSSGLDLKAITFMCLFSPMLDLKAIQLK